MISTLQNIVNYGSNVVITQGTNTGVTTTYDSIEFDFTINIAVDK